MAKAKRKKNKTLGKRFKVLMSFDWPRKFLPKSKEGILVAGETFTIAREWKFTVEQLDRLVTKGYLKELPPKKKKGKRRENV
jgi:hypothetical protein